MTTCLDSWAVLAWLDGDEPARSIVDECLSKQRPVMSWINLAEVHYRTHRDQGSDAATLVLNKLRVDFDCELPTERRIVEAALFKAAHPIALADCFAISTAADNDAVLFTGDPEILAIASLPCEVRDLRASG